MLPDYCSSHVSARCRVLQVVTSSYVPAAIDRPSRQFSLLSALRASIWNTRCTPAFLYILTQMTHVCCFSYMQVRLYQSLVCACSLPNCSQNLLNVAVNSFISYYAWRLQAILRRTLLRELDSDLLFCMSLGHRKSRYLVRQSTLSDSSKRTPLVSA
jgi:hypothetical protein